MKTLILIILICIAHCNVRAQEKRHLAQTFIITENGHWKAQGEPYLSPDSLTTIHAYKWKHEKIIAIQDYKKINGKWAKYGEPYPLPDTLKLIHGFIK